MICYAVLSALLMGAVRGDQASSKSPEVVSERSLPTRGRSRRKSAGSRSGGSFLGLGEKQQPICSPL